MIITRDAIEEFPFHGTFYDVYEKDPEDGDMIGDGNEDSSDGDLLGDEDEATASSETTEENTDTSNAESSDTNTATDNTDTAKSCECGCGDESCTCQTDTDIDTDTASNETILLETECDIQQAAKLINSGTIMADYKVFFPCDVGAKLPIRFNTKFRCEDYAIPIQGYVVGLEYSQLGGCHVDIKMNEV